MRITIINGPNLNLLGKREPETYGHQSFKDYFEELKSEFPEVEFHYFQSNVEGELVNVLQTEAQNSDGIILNAAAYTHTSVALGDAVAAVDCPVVEVHISNVYARETFRHHSYIAKHAKGVILGFGMNSYKLAIQSLLNQ